MDEKRIEGVGHCMKFGGAPVLHTPVAVLLADVLGEPLLVEAVPLAVGAHLALGTAPAEAGGTCEAAIIATLVVRMLIIRGVNIGIGGMGDRRGDVPLLLLLEVGLAARPDARLHAGVKAGCTYLEDGLGRHLWIVSPLY